MLQLKEIKICKRHFGEKHPDTLTSMYNLAVTRNWLGRHVYALDLMTRCVDLRMEILGVDHPHTTSASDTLLRWRSEGLLLEVWALPVLPAIRWKWALNNHLRHEHAYLQPPIGELSYWSGSGMFQSVLQLTEEWGAGHKRQRCSGDQV